MGRMRKKRICTERGKGKRRRMKHQEFSPLPTRSHTIAVSAIQPVMTIHLLPNCFSQLSQMCWPTFTHSPHPWTKTFQTFLLLPPLWPTNHRSDSMGSENGALRGTISLLFVLLSINLWKRCPAPQPYRGKRDGQS